MESNVWQNRKGHYDNLPIAPVTLTFPLNLQAANEQKIYFIEHLF